MGCSDMTSRGPDLLERLFLDTDCDGRKGSDDVRVSRHVAGFPHYVNKHQLFAFFTRSQSRRSADDRFWISDFEFSSLSIIGIRPYS